MSFLLQHSSNLAVLSARLCQSIFRTRYAKSFRSWCFPAGPPETSGRCATRQPALAVPQAGHGSICVKCLAGCGQTTSCMQPALMYHGIINLFMQKQQMKHTWVDCRVPFVEAQLRTGKVLSDADIQRFCENGQLDEALAALVQREQQGNVASVKLYGCLLKECSRRRALVQAKKVHSCLAEKGLASGRFLGEYLVSTMVKCGSIDDAVQIFGKLTRRTVFSWTALISGYTRSGQPQEALRTYWWMQHEGVAPNTYTLVSLIKACGAMADLTQGRLIHAEASKYGYEADSFVGTCLIDMYAKCGSIGDAQILFHGLSQRNVVSWTVMLFAYLELGQGEEALHLYDRMREEGVTPDVRTFVGALRACGMLLETDDAAGGRQVSRLKCLVKAKELHADAQRMGYVSNGFVGNTLISVYGKCGRTQEAYNVFSGLHQRDVVSWNAMLTAYAMEGQGEEAWQLFRKMREARVSPNDATLVCVLKVCSSTASLELCRRIHQVLLSCGKHPTACLMNALIHAYGRCGSMVDAQAVFDGASGPGVLLWTALIAGYAQQGNYTASIHHFKKMQLAGVQPDGVTFTAILSACSHAGLVEEGLAYFCSMSRDYGISPELQHYASVIDILGRAGDFGRVQHLLATMPMEPDLAIWSSLLGACRKHRNVMLGKQAFQNAVSLQPRDGSAYVMMSDIYADAGLWEQQDAVKALRDKEVPWKKAGKSWIQHEQTSSTFVAEDFTHLQSNHLHDSIELLSLRLNEKSGTDFISALHFEESS